MRALIKRDSIVESEIKNVLSVVHRNDNICILFVQDKPQSTHLVDLCTCSIELLKDK